MEQKSATARVWTCAVKWDSCLPPSRTGPCCSNHMVVAGGYIVCGYLIIALLRSKTVATIKANKLSHTPRSIQHILNTLVYANIMPYQRIMPALRILHRSTRHDIGQRTHLFLQLDQFDLRSLLFPRQNSKKSLMVCSTIFGSGSSTTYSNTLLEQ